MTRYGQTRREHAIAILQECDRALIQNLGPEEAKLTNSERRGFYSDAYPWGERKYHPYKVWLATIKEHLVNRARLKAFSSSPQD